MVSAGATRAEDRSAVNGLLRSAIGAASASPVSPGSDFAGPIGVYASMSGPVSSSIASKTSV
jgi:hypothetical protein